MKRLRVWLVGLSLFGCGAEDPKIGRLKPGSEAVVTDDPKYPTPYGHATAQVPDGSGLHGSDYVYVAFETAVEVLEDSGEPSDPKRAVRVRITEGENRGLSARFERWYLRPLPAK